MVARGGTVEMLQVGGGNLQIGIGIGAEAYGFSHVRPRRIGNRRSLLENQHRAPVLRKPARHGRPQRTAAHHQYISPCRHRGQFNLDGE